MANVMQKSIKYPGLDDTYTFVQLDDTLAVSGKAADAKAVGDALALKQDTLTFDDSPTASSDNPVKSGGVYTALAGKKDVCPLNYFDSYPYWNEQNTNVALSSGRVTVAQVGADVTLNTPTVSGATGTPQINTVVKLDKTLGVSARTNSNINGYLGDITYDTVLRAGLTYKLSADVISGSWSPYTGESPDAAYIRLYVLPQGATTFADALTYISLNNSQIISVGTDTNVALVIRTYVKGITISNLKVRVMLQQIDYGIPYYYLTKNVTYGDYGTYLNKRISDININADSLGEHSDSFIFLTDYHGTLTSQNAGHSPALIEEIVKQTGVSKLFLGGDVGRNQESDTYTRWTPAREDAEVYADFEKRVPMFYGVVGNHEWNERQTLTDGAMTPHAYAYSNEAVYNYYLARFARPAIEMDANGNYYIDNTRAKIRYFFLQCDGFCAISNDTVEWFAEQLAEIPAGYAVRVIMHLAFLNQVCYGMSGGEVAELTTYQTLATNSLSGLVNLSVKRISVLLDALQKGKSSSDTGYTVYKYTSAGAQDGTVTFDYSGKSRTVICVLCGHMHRDMVLEKDDSNENSDGVLVVATTTDSFANNLDYNSSGVLVTRERGTITEQAFDVVQIDLENKKLYMTRIGGGSDRELSFA